jgi:hypothetical protein
MNTRLNLKPENIHTLDIYFALIVVPPAEAGCPSWKPECAA